MSEHLIPVKTGNEPFIFLAVRLRFHLTRGLQIVKVLKEEQPRGLLDVVEFVTTARFVAENAINSIKGRFVFHVCITFSVNIPTSMHHLRGGSG